MIQLLSSLIEWLAILTLSSIGIDMEPVGCASLTPTEYRTVTAVYTPGDDAFAWSTDAASDCVDAAVRILPINDTPYLVTQTPAGYDS